MTASTTQTEKVAPPVRRVIDTSVPAANRALNALDAAARKSSIEAGRQEQVRARAAQVNGCASCVDTHSRRAGRGRVRAPILRVIRLARDTVLQCTRARRPRPDGVDHPGDRPLCPDDVFERVVAQFCGPELAELSWLIAVLNTWNRLGAAARPWPLD